MEDIDALDESPIGSQGEEASNGSYKQSDSSEVIQVLLSRRKCSTLKHLRDPSCRKCRNCAVL